jgi:hypothetical protein
MEGLLIPKRRHQRREEARDSKASRLHRRRDARSATVHSVVLMRKGMLNVDVDVVPVADPGRLGRTGAVLELTGVDPGGTSDDLGQILGFMKSRPLCKCLLVLSPTYTPNLITRT